MTGDQAGTIEVTRAGILTAIQDWPGRLGYWHVGVPPSGPMDSLSFRLANRALGNPEGIPGLECTLKGPVLHFATGTIVCLTGAHCRATLDGGEMQMWSPVTVPAGATLDVGTIDGPGLRTYLAFVGGLDVPRYLGSAATFTLGQLGGLEGRMLKPGDVLRLGPSLGQMVRPVPVVAQPPMANHWRIAVLPGPHGDAEFFTRADVDAMYSAAWQVHFNSSRTGVRLMGPQPQWARTDGGEAGLHPSNIHDTPYAIGAIDYTGDMPILLGPDGPSLGGFVCPATVVSAERWKLGQLRPGDEVRFEPVSDGTAAAMRRELTVGLDAGVYSRRPTVGRTPDDGVLAREDADGSSPAVTYRRAGDENLLIEFGEMTLELGLRIRVHALAELIAAEVLPGLTDLTPGIRSLQLHVDPDLLTVARALEMAQALERELPDTEHLTVPSREVHLPLSWDDPETRLAIERYESGVRKDAPWCPSNIEFIRRINGLPSTEAVRAIVMEAEYLVLGLGDVYLGAPVATPLDPRHRLVTTKYNPARTWTPENAVGIGGAYLCIYGIEGPGGYQFVGRTTQIWDRRTPQQGEAEEPWRLDFFDRIRWYPVDHDELIELRADMAAGRREIAAEPGTFSLASHRAFLSAEAESIAAFGATQTAAFTAEREAWQAASVARELSTSSRPGGARK